ncbi:MAG: hypothetical protein ACD_45C00568G0002 [uncultured bacterium]|nr:MAG: hypothetical protein ACD_45C00568G0002 [uncultured bacterium]
MTFWRGKRVLITGHTGFKGSWMALWLQMLGAELVGYSLEPPTEPNLFTLAAVAKNMKSVIADVGNRYLLCETLQAFQPDIVFHMAAQSLVRAAYLDPVETYASNVMGTVHLFEAIRQTNTVRAVINITSDKCYENNEWCWGYREHDRLGGHDPYSNSKACAELVTSAYRDSYFRAMQIGLASVRAGNVIGGGDWAADRLIPDMMRAFVNNESVPIRNPNALRPWQYVLEPLSGYLLLAERLYQSPLAFAESWNFGPNERDVKPVKWVVDFFGQYLERRDAWYQDAANHPHEAQSLKLDCSKALLRLGWQPRLDLEKGLAVTARWYRAYLAKENMRDVSLLHIKDYMNQTTNTRELCDDSTKIS